MAIYKMEKDYANGTTIEVNSNDKTLFNRLEIAIDHTIKQYNEEEKRKAKRK